LCGVARVLPVSILTFALGGAALMGIQPSGAYLAKDLLLQAATEKGQWWWTIVLQAGGLLTAAYVLLVLAHALAPADKSISLVRAPPRIQEAAALVLALCSLLLGLVPWELYLPVPCDTSSNPFGLEAFFSSLLPIAGGAVLAILLARWARPLAYSMPWKSARRVCLGLGRRVERGDEALRQWPAASISLLMLVLLFSASMLAAS
jgi:NADH:ubiquinone oxidoreductase subunit 5 (subunit L)/multisubunit Na+/H+ antiporter MnhA subunit